MTTAGSAQQLLQQPDWRESVAIAHAAAEEAAPVAAQPEPEPSAEPLNEKFVSVYPYNSEGPGDLVFEAGEVVFKTRVQEWSL